MQLEFCCYIQLERQFQIPTFALAASPSLASSINQTSPTNSTYSLNDDGIRPSSFASENSLGSALGVRPAWVAPKSMGAFNFSGPSAAARSFGSVCYAAVVRPTSRRHRMRSTPEGSNGTVLSCMHRCLPSKLLDILLFEPVNGRPSRRFMSPVPSGSSSP